MIDLLIRVLQGLAMLIVTLSIAVLFDNGIRRMK